MPSNMTVVLLLLLYFRQLIVAFNAFLDGFARLADVAGHSKGKMCYNYWVANSKLLSELALANTRFQYSYYNPYINNVLTIYINFMLTICAC